MAFRIERVSIECRITKTKVIGPLQDPVTWYGINYLELKLRSGTFKTKGSRAGLVRFSMFWNSHCVTYVPAELLQRVQVMAEGD